MLPRPIVTAIVCLLTIGELVNIAGQVFLGTGDTAIHVMFPAVLGALGLTAKKPDPKPSDPPGEPVANGGTPPPTELARHRRESR